MSHRTDGATHNCAGCRYWSEMIAKSHGPAVLAMCIAPEGSPLHGKYTREKTTCSAWASGHLGAVDEPGQDPNAYAGETACPPTP